MDIADKPSDFYNLTKEEQETLTSWIMSNIIPTKKTFYSSVSSYGLKHCFERSDVGFYIHNGAFKGAMLECGFLIKDKSELNWYFNISKKSPFIIKGY